MTEQRRVIAQVLEAADDHPDVEELYARAAGPRFRASRSPRSTAPRVKLFEESGIIDRLEFGERPAPANETPSATTTTTLIDMNSGAVIEFCDPPPRSRPCREKIAEKLGYRLKGHKLELYGVPLRKKG